MKTKKHIVKPLTAREIRKALGITKADIKLVERIMKSAGIDISKPKKKVGKKK